MQFKNLCGMLCLNLKTSSGSMTIGRIEVVDNTGAALWGNASVNVSDIASPGFSGATVTNTTSEQKNVVILDCSEVSRNIFSPIVYTYLYPGTNINTSSKPFYIVVPTNTLTTNFKVVIYDNFGRYITAFTTNQAAGTYTIARSSVTNMKAKAVTAGTLSLSDVQTVEYIGCLDNTENDNYFTFIDTGEYLTEENITINAKVRNHKYLSLLNDIEMDIIGNNIGEAPYTNKGRFALFLYNNSIWMWERYGETPKKSLTKKTSQGTSYNTYQISANYKGAGVNHLLSATETPAGSSTKTVADSVIVKQTSISNSSSTIKLFNSGVTNPRYSGHYLDFYSLDFTIGTTLKYDFIPCYLKASKTIGVFDKVSNRFYTCCLPNTAFTKGSDVTE